MAVAQALRDRILQEAEEGVPFRNIPDARLHDEAPEPYFRWGGG
jgi:hypothetical protein